MPNIHSIRSDFYGQEELFGGKNPQYVPHLHRGSVQESQTRLQKGDANISLDFHENAIAAPFSTWKHLSRFKRSRLKIWLPTNLAFVLIHIDILQEN